METTVNSTSTKSAIAEWVTILSESGVVAGGAADFGASTIGTTRSIPAVLRPENQEQVAAVLQVAQRWQVAVYPVSTDNNCAYGSVNLVEDGLTSRCVNYADTRLPISRPVLRYPSRLLAWATIKPGSCCS